MTPSDTIILPGGAGFLGSHVHAALLARGHDPARIIVPRSSTCDLTLYRHAHDLLAAHPAATHIIHCAGYVGGLGLNRAHPARMFRDNLLIAMHLAEAAAQTGFAARGGKLTIVGSMTSYPADAPIPYREDDLFRGAPDREIASYGVAKLACLQLLRAYRAEFGLRSAYPILVNLYGPGDHIDDERRGHAAGSLLKRFVDAADQHLPEVVCWGTGSPSRDFLFVTDAAEGVLRAAETIDDATPVNIASGHETTLKELAELIARLAGFSGRITWDPAKGDGVTRRCLDITRARTLLGWSPTVPLDAGMRQTIDAYRAAQRQRTA
jgi:GDP-L-fucose synthase